MNTIARKRHQPWNKGKLVGQKAPLLVRDIWAIRVRLQLAEKPPPDYVQTPGCIWPSQSSR